MLNAINDVAANVANARDMTSDDTFEGVGVGEQEVDVSSMPKTMNPKV